MNAMGHDVPTLIDVDHLGVVTKITVRKDQPAGDDRAPGWYKHPPGTVAYEFAGALASPARFKAEGTGSMPPLARPAVDTEVKVREPRADSGQHKQH